MQLFYAGKQVAFSHVSKRNPDTVWVLLPGTKLKQAVSIHNPEFVVFRAKGEALPFPGQPKTRRSKSVGPKPFNLSEWVQDHMDKINASMRSLSTEKRLEYLAILQ